MKMKKLRKLVADLATYFPYSTVQLHRFMTLMGLEVDQLEKACLFIQHNKLDLDTVMFLSARGLLSSKELFKDRIEPAGEERVEISVPKSLNLLVESMIACEDSLEISTSCNTEEIATRDGLVDYRVTGTDVSVSWKKH